MNQTTSGKHMICDIKNITNHKLLNDPKQISHLLDQICQTYNYTILQKSQHIFEPQGFTAIYLLSESHISIHTFPEKNYAAIDIYTCRQYPDNQVYLEIYDYIIQQFKADPKQQPTIIDRVFT
uniref:Adenosylmethionine decarboxylase n=1 Tax=viral metagenome TaxID=1070528 RepID=A0A6C0JL05_9ZZZZ